VTANLDNSAANTGEAQGDTYNGVENLDGSNFADALTGDGGANLIQGYNGDDSIAGGNGDDALYGMQGNDTIAGGIGNDLVHGGAGSDVLDGGAGDDTLFGGTGNDLFVFRDGGGHDQVLDFTPGAGTDDRIDLSAIGTYHNLGDVLAHTTMAGANAVIDLGGGNSLTLSGVNMALLHASDFLF
jgi:Ca2+-binding RTX toxin-like protein